MSYRDDILAPYRWVRELWLKWLRTPAKSRIDRGRMYLWVHVGLIVVGATLHLHPYGIGPLVYFTRDQNHALATAIITGSTACILGALMGTQYWFPSAVTDIRLPYLFAAGGQISVIASLVSYEWALAQHVDVYQGALPGALGYSILGGCAHTALVALKEIHRINRLDRIVTRQRARLDDG